jgi:hypothetical protein
VRTHHTPRGVRRAAAALTGLTALQWQQLERLTDSGAWVAGHATAPAASTSAAAAAGTALQRLAEPASPTPPAAHRPIAGASRAPGMSSSCAPAAPHVTASRRSVTRSRSARANTAQQARTRTGRADVSVMATIQIIELHGRLAALAVAGVAIVDEHVPSQLLAHVCAKALYALQIQAGERPGPYRDADAEHYARQVAATIAAPPSRPAGRRSRRAGHRRRPLQP